MQIPDYQNYTSLLRYATDNIFNFLKQQKSEIISFFWKSLLCGGGEGGSSRGQNENREKISIWLDTMQYFHEFLFPDI